MGRPIMFRALLRSLLPFFLFTTFQGNAQVVAGIRANTRIMGFGDTINVCKGSAITYQSAATGSLNISWRFTHGGTLTFAAGVGPITIVYNTNGFDTAFQRVVGGAFSDSTFIIVRVSDVAPVAAYNFTPDSECGNINVQFTNNSSMGEPHSYLWNFSDGVTTTEENPTHQFLNAVGLPGSEVFAVKLVVKNIFGCRDSVTHPVTVKRVPDASVGNAEPTVSFGLFNGIQTFKKCNNIPAFNFKFRNMSTTIANNISYRIQWGEGSPDSVFTSWPTGQVIGHTFPIGGSTMTVNVIGPDGCIGIKKYIVFLGTNPAGGLASLGNTDICSSDSLRFVITNTANNPPGTTYSFLINDDYQPQLFQHPPPTTVAHYFNNGSCFSSSNNGMQTYTNSFGAFLTIENPCGSNSASVVPIYVSGKPRPLISLPTPVVCVNTNVTITNASSFGNVVSATGTFTSDCINNGIKVWKISPSTGYSLVSGSLGSLNGNPLNGLLWSDGSNNLNVRFTATGIYTIKIYVYNDRCGLDSTMRTICVRNPPQAAFTLAQRSSCGPVTINPVNTSPIGGCQGDDYQWSVTYSDPEGCAVTTPVTHSFAGSTNENSAFPSIQLHRIGRFIIRLTVSAHNSPYGCPDMSVSDTFYIKGPPAVTVSPITSVCVGNNIAPAATHTNCYAPGPFGYQWSFANGTPAISTQLLPGNIQFTTTGSHPIQLIVTDSSCMLSDTVNTTVTIFAAPPAEAGNDASVCSGTSVLLGVTPVNGVTYQWSPSTGLSNAAIANPIFSLPYNGPSSDTVYTYFLSAFQGTNCSNLDSVKITVRRKPLLSVSPTSGALCVGNNILLTASGADNYAWSPAAGLSGTNTDIVTATPLSNTTYTVVGSLANGCSDTKQIPITVYPDADAQFITGDTVRCAPININNQVSNTLFPAGNGTYSWYANGALIGSNTNGAVPTYSITAPGDTVSIKLVTTSQHGCRPDSMQRTFITRPSVIAAFTKDRDSACAPLQVLFTNTSTDVGSGVQFFWNFGNGSTTTAVQPGVISFSTSQTFRDTVYRIVLKAFNGCDTTYYRDSVKVFARSKARFSVDTTRGCSPFILHISNTSLGNNFAYYWDFGDGHTDTTNTTGSFTHTYFTGVVSNYTVRLISENQCTRDTQSIVIVVQPNVIQPFITVNGNQVAGCAPHLVTFNNSTIGATQLTFDFGDNSPTILVPNNQNIISHLFTQPGNYSVAIRLRNDCSDTLIHRTVTVFDKPVAAFSQDVQKLCTSQAVTVTNASTNANAYEWQWGDGQTSSFTSGQHIYSSPGLYTIKLIAKKVHSSGFICYDTTSRQITVVNKLPAQISIQPGKLCAPYTLNVNAGYISGYSSIKWVIYDSSTSQGEFHLSGLSATHVYNSPGSFWVKLIVYTTAGCVDSSIRQFRVYSTPRNTFGPELVKTCNHDTTISYMATATNTGGEQVNYKWFINGSIEGTTNPFQYNYQQGVQHSAPIEYTLQALAENAGGCGDTSMPGKMIVQPLPFPKIAVSPGLVIQQPDYTFYFKDTVATHAAKNYVWYMGDRSLQTRNGRETSYEYGDTGRYNVRLVVTDNNTGCSASDSIVVSIRHVPGFLHVPNAMCLGCSNYSLRQFLPLGKGLKTYRLRIYNAWGQKVFETSKLDANGSPSEPWDGKYNGQLLQQDVYSWQIEGMYTNGTEWRGMLYPGSNKAVKAGFITIIK